jgi:hypothetical protein
VLTTGIDCAGMPRMVCADDALGSACRIVELSSAAEPSSAANTSSVT